MPLPGHKILSVLMRLLGTIPALLLEHGACFVGLSTPAAGCGGELPILFAVSVKD
jgi:hypothetical protein